MKKLFLFSLICSVMMFGFCLQAQAVTFVDTGAGPVNQGGWVLANYQWLAAEFSLSQASTITDVYGWISHYGSPGTATLAIYGDGGNVPDSSNELFSAAFTIPSYSDTDTYAAWNGAAGLNWSLANGTYWVSFEVRPGDTYYGAMPNDSISPLGTEAFWNGSNWNNQDSLNTGVKILGRQGGAVIPEPASLSLLGLGLLGLLRRKRV